MLSCHSKCTQFNDAVSIMRQFQSTLSKEQLQFQLFHPQRVLWPEKWRWKFEIEPKEQADYLRVYFGRVDLDITIFVTKSGPFAHKRHFLSHNWQCLTSDLFKRESSKAQVSKVSLLVDQVTLEGWFVREIKKFIRVERHYDRVSGVTKRQV